MRSSLAGGRAPAARAVSAVVVLALVTAVSAASAADAPSCPDVAPELDASQYLRSLSLHLRGVPPTLEEYEAVDSGDALLEALVDEWLASDAFADRVVRHHRALLWNNISLVTMLSNRHSVGTSGGIYYRSAHTIFYRGNYNLPCVDEPAEFDDDGQIVLKPDEDGYLREGWVWVAPWWAPETSIKMCALDAQGAEYAPNGDACGSLAGNNEMACGCGPDLLYCYRGEHASAIQAAFGREVELRVRQNILDDAPYTELFTGDTAWVNGPIVHFLRYLAPLYQSTRFDPLAWDLGHLPDLTWHDSDTWLPVMLPEAHAGILTSPAFLLRFQTNRARANRFYDAFLCQPFQPPAGGIPASSDTSVMEPDLQKRAGCKYCHALLEPAGAHWGRWPQYGTGYLGEETYPAFRQDCLQCAVAGGCPEDCSRFYVTAATSDQEAPYIGMLQAYLFRRDEHALNVEAGPKFLVKSAIVDNRLPTCVARRTAEHLMGRELGGSADLAWLDDLSFGFVASGFSYRDLVREIVLSDAYGRVR